jgi:hypothetical protein
MYITSICLLTVFTSPQFVCYRYVHHLNFFVNGIYITSICLLINGIYITSLFLSINGINITSICLLINGIYITSICLLFNGIYITSICLLINGIYITSISVLLSLSSASFSWRAISLALGCSSRSFSFWMLSCRTKEKIVKLSRIQRILSVAYPGCLSWMRIFSIPDPGSASKNLSILTQKIVSNSWKYDPCCSSRIWILIFYPYFSGSRGQKGTGSGSATERNNFL